MSRFIRERGLEGGFAILNPGAGWASKRWPVEWFAALARHLGQKRHLPTLVTWAGDEEWSWADRIVTTAAGWTHPAPRTTLAELAELSRRARLFVGNDTGPLHLAAAVGTPCVGLFGPMPAERNGPYGPAHISLQNVRVTASKRELKRMDNVSMRAISVEEVCDACDQLLDRREIDFAEDPLDGRPLDRGRRVKGRLEACPPPAERLEDSRRGDCHANPLRSAFTVSQRRAARPRCPRPPPALWRSAAAHPPTRNNRAGETAASLAALSARPS